MIASRRERYLVLMTAEPRSGSEPWRDRPRAHVRKAIPGHFEIQSGGLQIREKPILLSIRTVFPRKGVRGCFGTFAEGIVGVLKRRHDHGSQFVADDSQHELAFLGIARLPAFVREPEANGCVERFIRTLKETCCRSAASPPSR
jgi:hypothetical protein